MRLIALSLAIFCGTVLAAQTVTKVAFTESKNVVRAFSPSGEIMLPVAEVQLDLHYPAGKNERGDLVVVYDPENGHYFWRYSRTARSGNTTGFLGALQSGVEAVYSSSTGLIDFYLPGALYAKEHIEKASNLDAAENAASEEITWGLPIFEKHSYHNDYQEITVAHEIDRAFFCGQYGDPGFNGLCHYEATKFVSISREAGKWRLVVRNHWDQEIILDARFKLVSTSRLPAPAK